MRKNLSQSRTDLRRRRGQGIDAIVFDEDSNELFVLQSKHRKSATATQGECST